MALWKPFAGKVRRSRLAFYRPLVAGREGRRLLIRSYLVALLSGVVFALEASAGFLTAPTYPAGSRPWTVAVADFNGDGIPDLAVANLGDSGNGAGVSILLGKGDGTFQAPISYVFGSCCRFRNGGGL